MCNCKGKCSCKKKVISKRHGLIVPGQNIPHNESKQSKVNFGSKKVMSKRDGLIDPTHRKQNLPPEENKSIDIICGTKKKVISRRLEIDAPNGHSHIKKSNGDTITIVDIPSGQTVSTNISDSVITLKTTSGTVLSVTNVKATEPKDIEAPDSTVNVNGSEFSTVESGGVINVPVVNGGSNPVGTIDGGQVVIADSLVQINGTTVGDIVAEDSLSIGVELDGVPSGTWNAMDQVWEVESAPCPTDLLWELNFNGTDDVIFIPATVGNVGTFTSGSGSNVGTVTVSTDGVTYGTLSFPFTPTAGNTYYFKRSTATFNGLFTLIGTY